jgi:hypothetical protein
VLEVTAKLGEPTEAISVALSENRGEQRATLRFLAEEVATTPGSLDEVPPVTNPATDRRSTDAPLAAPLPPPTFRAD